MNYNTNQCSEYAVKDTEGRDIAETLTELENKPSGTKLYKHVLQLSEGTYNRITYYNFSPNEVIYPNFSQQVILSDIRISRGTAYPQSNYQVDNYHLSAIRNFGDIEGTNQIILIKLNVIGQQVHLVQGVWTLDGTYTEQSTYLGTITSDTVTPL